MIEFEFTVVFLNHNLIQTIVIVGSNWPHIGNFNICIKLSSARMLSLERPTKTRAIFLTEDNFEEWKRFILERAMTFGEPGRALRNSTPINIREPTREDRRHNATKVIIDEAEWVALLAERMGDEDDADSLNDIEDALGREYPAMYRNDIQYEEAYKRYSRKLDDTEKNSPLLMAFMLEYITTSAKNKLIAQTNYIIADRTEDPLLMWNTIEDVFARAGDLSEVTIRMEYNSLKQDELTFDEYVTRTRDILKKLASINIRHDNGFIVTQFLINLRKIPGVWDNKVHTLLATTPLPDLEVAIKELMKTRQIMKTNNQAHTDDYPRPRKAKGDIPIMNATTKDPPTDTRGDYVTICWNCDRKGHTGKECRGAKAVCTTCHKPGHLAKHHDFFERVMTKYKRGPKDVTVGKTTIQDDYDDDNYGDSLCWSLMLTIEPDSEDDTLDMIDCDSDNESDYEDELCYMTDSHSEDAPEDEDDWEYNEAEDYTLVYPPTTLSTSTTHSMYINDYDNDSTAPVHMCAPDFTDSLHMTEHDDHLDYVSTPMTHSTDTLAMTDNDSEDDPDINSNIETIDDHNDKRLEDEDNPNNFNALDKTKTHPVPDEWRWTTQIATPAYSTAHDPLEPTTVSSQEHIDNQTIKTHIAKAPNKPKYITSEDMVADYYTKPMTSTQSIRHTIRVYCNPQEDATTTTRHRPREAD